MVQTSILIAIKETVIGEYYEKILKKAGHKVKLVSNGKSALEAAKKDLPNIILLGGRFADIDGIDVCRELKNSDETKDIKVIMDTVRAQSNYIEMGLGAGADLYITAPHSLDVLTQVVNDAISNPNFPGEEIKQIDVVNAPTVGN